MFNFEDFSSRDGKDSRDSRDNTKQVENQEKQTSSEVFSKYSEKQLWFYMFSINGKHDLLKKNLKQFLFNKYIPDIQKIVEREFSRIPSRSLAEKQDIFQAAIIGHLESMDSYDPGVGTSYMQFSYRRIRGAIIDCLRKLQHLPRNIAGNRRIAAPIIEKVSHKLGKSPTVQDVFDNCDRDSSSSNGNSNNCCLHSIISDPLFNSGVYTQVTICSQNDEISETEVVNIIEDSSSKKKSVNRDLEKRIIRLLKNEGSENVSFVIWAYYYQGMTTTEIASTLNMGAPTISRMHERGIKLLHIHFKYEELKGLIEEG